MDIFEPMAHRGHEQVVFCHEESIGLRAIIAIHDTTLGPSLGGARLRPYASDEEALRDALRLSEAMTYKAAVAGLGLGGGKAVIIADPKQKSEALLRAFGRFVNTLGGRYITAEDVNTSVEDMEMVLSETKHVCGLSVFRGGSGDPSPVTAYGVLVGLKATAEEAFGSDDLRGKRVAVQGLGKVGYHLAKHLVEEGADVVACDIREERAQQARNELSVEIVSHEDLLEVDCDIVAPCALGAALNDDTIPRLRCKVVAGAANNQLAETRHAADLEDRGILYAPDYVINSGGLINVYCELDGYNRDRALRLCNQIGHSLKLVYAIAKQEGINTDKAANLMARRRIDSVRRLRRFSSRGQNV
ncbi:MAG: Glu/Leu/Phe/Val dehydrogenase dimerization domain-containing protein [Planctomycetota bacterium]|jgi:leucine dehydrogenase